MLGWLLKPVTVVSAIALSTASILSRKYQRVKLYYHLGIYLSTLGALSIWGVLVSILATAAGQRLNINYFVARSFYHVCSPLVGIKLEVEGEEHLSGLVGARDGKGQSAVLVGNHQSVLDILFLGRIFPRRAAIMAKKELKWAPLLGQYLSLSGGVFVDRKNRKAAQDALEKAGDDMKKRGVSLWVFPEGTRSSCPEPTLLPFKKGAFHLAVQAQVPIVPVVCENYHRLFDSRTRMEEGHLKIRVLPPIPTEGLTADDVTRLAESTRDAMLATLKEISAPGPAPPQPMEMPKSPVTEETTSQDEPMPRTDTTPAFDGAADKRVGGSSEGGRSRASGDSTEDEMDEDAVLLRRPSAA